MEPTFFIRCNILYVDHLAVTTLHIDQTLVDYLSMLGSRLIRGPAINPAQNVQYAFVQLANGLVVEILSPLEGSPVNRHVAQQGGGPYHFCFAVANIEASIGAAEKMGAKLIIAPVSDIAFDGRKIAFLFHELHGMFEFVEAYPATLENINKEVHIATEITSASPNTSTSNIIKQQLNDILTKVFSITDASQISQSALNKTPGWDSLGHIRLMMAIETACGVSIPAARIPELTSFIRVCEYLEKNGSHIMENL